MAERTRSRSLVVKAVVVLVGMAVIAVTIRSLIGLDKEPLVSTRFT